jgi:hypothetical protein
VCRQPYGICQRMRFPILDLRELLGVGMLPGWRETVDRGGEFARGRIPNLKRRLRAGVQPLSISEHGRGRAGEGDGLLTGGDVEDSDAGDHRLVIGANAAYRE